MRYGTRGLKFNCIFVRVRATVGTRSFSAAHAQRGVNARYECRRTADKCVCGGRHASNVERKRYMVNIINRFWLRRARRFGSATRVT